MAEKKPTAFEKALTQAVLSRYQAQIDADNEPVEFSEAHKAAVEKLTKKTKRRSWKYVNTTAKRILIAAILVGLLAATAFAAVPALRKKQANYEMRNDGVAINFKFSDVDLENAPKEIQTYYAPTYIPEGYALGKEISTPIMLSQHYTSPGKVSMNYQQLLLWELSLTEDASPGDISVLGIDGEYEKLETLNIDGYEVRVYQYYSDGKDDIIVVWTDLEYFFILDGPTLSNSEIVKIVASLQPYNP